MRLSLAYITPRGERLKSAPAQTLLQEYIQRAQRFCPVESLAFRSEPALLAAAAQRSGRLSPFLILLDSRGRTLSSRGFADLLGRHRDEGTQEIMLCIGPADGWSPAAHAGAGLLLSLGEFTLPHELALAVLAEQVYRAFTILAGHPYHSGHE